MAARKRKAVHAVTEAEPSTSSSSAHNGVPRAVESNAGLPTSAGDDVLPPAIEVPPAAGDDVVPPASEVPPAPVDEDEPFTPVKRSRYDKTGSAEFWMDKRLCFKGGFLMKECILPTKYFGDDQMMKVGGREDWLVSSATGKVERRGHFEKGVLLCKKDIIAAISVAASAAQDGKVKAASAGRNLLEIPTDSDSSPSSGEEDEGKQQETVDNPLDGVVHMVKYRGLKFKAVLYGRLVYVEARVDVAKRIVGACLKAAVAVIKEETKQDLEGPPPAPLADEDPVQEAVKDGSREPDQARVVNPRGKPIRFDARRSCYEIFFVEEQGGSIHRGVKGLHAKVKDKGKPLSPMQCEVNMAAAFEKAKKLWNTSDKSDLPRFP